MEIVAGYLDLKPLLTEQEKQYGSDDLITYGEFEQVFAFRNGNHQNRFKNETCTYCNKKGDPETVCFAKYDDNKLTKMAKTVSAAMVEQIAATNTKTMESILETLKKMNLKV